MEKCKDCNWWKLIENDKSGQFNGKQKGRCRGRAPMVTAVVMPVMHQITREVTPQILEVTTWPITGADEEACGDFVVKVKPLTVPSMGPIRINPSDLG